MRSKGQAATFSPVENAIGPLLACPRCRSGLELAGDACRCRGCGASFPAPGGIPRLADGAVERDGRMAAEWEAQHHAHHLYVDTYSIANRWERLVLPQIARHLAGVNGPVLDVGCGVGHLGQALVDTGIPVELYGLDFQAELLEDARTGYAGRVEGDVHRMPLRDGGFAAVVAANTLHHVADAPAALREIARVLRPGGRLVAYDPRALAPLELLKRVLRRGDKAFTADHRAFRPAEYAALIEGAGFTVEAVVGRDHVGPLVAAGLDLLHAGRIGVSQPVAALLASADAAIARLDARGVMGLMVLALARR